MTARVAVVGTGFMAGTHLEAWDALGAEIAAIVSRSHERGGELAKSRGATLLSSLEEALADESIDVIDLCIPTDLHVDAAEAALAAGKHVLLEKPISLDVAGADRLIVAEAKANGKLMVAHVIRFWPEYAAFLQRHADATYGTLETFSAYRLSAPAGWNEWMRDESRSGGVALDLMIHDIDFAIAVMGPVEEVSAAARDDRQHIFATLKHRGGGVSNIEGSMAMPTAFPFSCGFRAVGTEATAQYEFRVGISVDGGNLGAAATPLGLLEVPVEGDAMMRDVEQSDSFQNQLGHFLRALDDDGTVTMGTASQAREALAAAVAIRDALAD